MLACPACGASLPEGKTVQCACGQWSRIEERPERPCSACGQAIALAETAIRCPHCDHLQATDPDRAVRTVADCPRCRRRIDVDAHAEAGSCPHCGQNFLLRDTL